MSALVLVRGGIRQTPSTNEALAAPPAPSRQHAHAKPPRPLLTAAEAAREIYGISERQFHKLREQHMVPAPVMLGPRCLRWLRTELEAAAATLPRQTALDREPEQLRRGRVGRPAKVTP